MPPEEDGSRYRAKIIEMIDDYKQGMDDLPEVKKFRCRVNNQYEEIVAYNDIVDFIDSDETWKDSIWHFQKILKHKKVNPGDPDYKGCQYNVQILWETGEITWEPLHTKSKEGCQQPSHGQQKGRSPREP